MKAFVTGGTGLLGNNLVRALIKEGHQVKVLARSMEKAQKVFEDLDIEIIQGDIANVQAFKNHMKGCDHLFHLAAYFSEYYQPGDHWPELKKINVDALLELYTEAEKLGIKQIVNINSSGAISSGTKDKPANEESIMNPEELENLYFRSKALAMKELASWKKSHKTPILTIFPGWMFGPYDAAPTKAGQLIINYCQHKIPFILPGGNPLVDARDIVKAILTAIKQNRKNASYVIPGQYYSLETLFKTLEDVSRIKGPDKKLSYFITMCIATFAGWHEKLTGKASLINPKNMKIMNRKRYTDDTKVKTELGLTYRSLEETLSDTHSWLDNNGYISTKDTLEKPAPLKGLA